MPISFRDKNRAFQNSTCRNLFSRPEHTHLRKLKPILAIVERHHLQIALYPWDNRKIATVVQALFLNGDLPYRPKPQTAPLQTCFSPNPSEMTATVSEHAYKFFVSGLQE